MNNSRENKNAFHEQELARVMVSEINEFGGNFTIEDITEYQIEETDLLSFEFGDYIGYVAPPPASGVILSFIINIMDYFWQNDQLPLTQNVEFHHKLLEAFKFGYGKRSLLGDPSFQEKFIISLLGKSRQN